VQDAYIFSEGKEKPITIHIDRGFILKTTDYYTFVCAYHSLYQIPFEKHKVLVN